MKICIIIAGFLFAIFASANIHANTSEVSDPEFSSRLTTYKTYQSTAHDTLSLIAYKLYSHKSWWQRFAQDNPELGQYGENDKLPLGTVIKYKASTIPDFYHVQKGDIFLRLVEWKWGSFENWVQEDPANKLIVKKMLHLTVGDLIVFGQNRKLHHISARNLPELKEDHEWKFYVADQDETAKTIAYKAFGSRSRWKDLSRYNKLVGIDSSREKIGKGTEIIYPGPKIGDRYVIKSGDTLSRVTLWKYGETGRWGEIYELNKSRIKNPHLIYPGDHLIFKEQIIEHKTKVEVLAEQAPALEPIPELPAVSDEGLNRTISMEAEPAPTSPNLYMIMLILGFVLLFIVFYYYIREKDKKGLNQLSRDLGELVEVKHEETERDPSLNGIDYINIFKSRKNMIPEKQIVHKEEMGYPLLLKKTRKLLSIFKK